MDIKNVNLAMNVEKATKPTKLTNISELEKEKKEDVALKSNISGRKGIASEVELNSILENLNSAESKIEDVEKAEEMIAKANSNILAAKNDAVLSQANQSKDVVEKLTN